MVRPIDLEKQNSEQEIKEVLHITNSSFWSILKYKVSEITLTELIARIISLVIIIPYTYNLYNGKAPLETYDTIAKLVLGAYIGQLVKKFSN